MDGIKLSDLKNMNIDSLELLAKDLRCEILNSVSQNGGHLSSNLGIVELTIALHKVFDSPKDLMIFDVSHQTYAHKLLTGRKLDNLRKMNGISGFSKYSESEHDVFEGGHSSTSIPAMLGFLEAKKDNNNINDVISIIGDSSITNGLAFEALNYLGAHPEQKAIIIINDNQMGISKSVGALAKSFDRIRVGGKLKLLRKITPNPIKRMLKSFAYRKNIFESLGIKYFEGIDGHNFSALLKYLKYAKESPKSVVLHVKTVKGKGYKFAEEDASGYWHHVSPFDLETGLPKSQVTLKSFGEEISDYLINKINSRNEKIRVITPAMTLGSGLNLLSNTCKKEFIDVGIAEETAVVMAASLALSNVRPYVFVYSTFLQRAYDEVLHDVARPNLPVVFCIDRASIIDADGDTHQGIFDIAYLSTIPNVEILAPKNVQEAKYALDYVQNVNHPVAIRYAKYDLNSSFLSDRDFSKWDVIKEGSISIITYGNMISYAYNLIKDTNIGLINAKNLSIIDENVVKSCTKLIVYEEVIDEGCLGSKLINYVYKNKIETIVETYNLGSTYLEVGSREELIKKYLNDLNDIIRKELQC